MNQAILNSRCFKGTGCIKSYEIHDTSLAANLDQDGPVEKRERIPVPFLQPPLIHRSPP